MQSDTSRRRRLYQRSHTLATLPTNIIREVDNENDEDTDTESSKLIKHSNDSPLYSADSCSELDKFSETDDELKPLSCSRHSSKGKKTAIFSSNRGGITSTPATFTIGVPGTAKEQHLNPEKENVQSETVLPGMSSNNSSAGSTNRHKKLGRTPSTPSMLLNKVKDRIREKMFSTEWPHAAAIIQERRQKAVDAFEAKLNQSGTSEADICVEQIQLKELHNKRKRARMKSDPIPAVVLTNADDLTPAEAARLAFRRRSISEDTYDRRPCLPTQHLKPQTNTSGAVICSDEDLRAIIGDSKKKKRSPKHNFEGQHSMESSSSSYSSGRTETDAESVPEHPHEYQDLYAFSPSQNYGSSPTTTVSTPQYPEVILSTRSKDNIRRESDPRYASNSSLLTEAPQEEEDLGPKAVPDIVFDEFGQTWDVYGAEFDPEILGNAIQKHLEHMMQKTMDTPKKTNEFDNGLDTQNNKDGKARESMNALLRFLCLFVGRRGESR